ncbi:MAG: 4-(cytidine 5'-diphospho)-2-C-methyl-D-erythritol kinase [Pseudomonadota bacterium]
MQCRAKAPAKVNLSLHVVGRRTDGYHLLDSLVAFASIGDEVTVRFAPGLSLATEGPNASAVPTDGSNLVLRAANLMSETNANRQGAALTLTKNLPAASGIGGGSSDAASTLSALSRLWDTPLPAPEEILALGADVPVCLRRRVTRMGGIGDLLDNVPALPKVWAVLANAGGGVSTPEVFARLERRDGAPMPTEIPKFQSAPELAEWLKTTRNDLERPALSIEPGIGDVLSALRASSGALLARMSGSGGTCFALFARAENAKQARQDLSNNHPGWWVEDCSLT